MSSTGPLRKGVGDVIFAPNDTISVEKRSNVMWATVRGAHTAAIMGVNTPAADGEQNPVVKHKGRPPYHGGHNNANRNNISNYNTRERDSLERTQNFRGRYLGPSAIDRNR